MLYESVAPPVVAVLPCMHGVHVTLVVFLVLFIRCLVLVHLEPFLSAILNESVPASLLFICICTVVLKLLACITHWCAALLL